MRVNKLNFFCIYPSFYGCTGHEISFVDSLVKFAKKNKSKICFVIPKESKVILKKKKINKILLTISKGYISLITNFIKNIFILKKLFKKNQFNNKNVYFIDGYSFNFLFSFLITKFFLKKEGTLLIYVRYDYVRLKLILFKIFLSLLKTKILKITLLTDSQSLSKIIYQKFNISVEILPIPHTFEKNKQEKKNKKKNFIFLCPGQFREEKYGENFNNFLKLNNQNRYNILINEKFSNLKIKNKIKFNFIKDNLSIKKYKILFNKADVVLLPYESNLYKLRTSGIFIEAVAQKKILLVTNNTWMSDELRKNNLNEFIVNNWKSFVFMNFLKKNSIKVINKKINLMSKKYLIMHNKNNYIDQLSKIVNG